MASIIEQRLVPQLSECFGPEVMRLQTDQSPFVIFPAKHSEVGDIAVYDDGDELTIVVGHFTHRHIGNYEEGLSDQQRADLIGKECVDFLKDIFADRMVFYGSHAGGGGCTPRTGEPRGFFSQVLFGEKHLSGPDLFRIAQRFLHLIPPNAPWCSLRQKQSGSLKPASERSFISTDRGV